MNERELRELGAFERVAVVVSSVAFVAVLATLGYGYNREWTRAEAEHASAVKWAYQVAAFYEQNEILTMQRDELRALVAEIEARPPVVRIVYRPCVEADPTPVFAHEWTVGR